MKHHGNARRVYLAEFAGKRVRAWLSPDDVDALENASGERLDSARRHIYDAIRRELEAEYELRYPVYSARLWWIYRVTVWPIGLRLVSSA